MDKNNNKSKEKYIQEKSEDMLSLAERRNNNPFLKKCQEGMKRTNFIPTKEQYEAGRKFFKENVEPLNVEMLRKAYKRED